MNCDFGCVAYLWVEALLCGGFAWQLGKTDCHVCGQPPGYVECQQANKIEKKEYVLVALQESWQRTQVWPEWVSLLS